MVMVGLLIRLESQSTVPIIQTSEVEADEISAVHYTDCDDKIYISNQFYDSNGLYRDPNEERYRKNMGDISSGRVYDFPNDNIGKVKDNPNSVTQTKKSPFVFINCGGTFPWPVEIFLETMPSAELYDIFSFIPDVSYSIFYTPFKNHKLRVSECAPVESLFLREHAAFGSEYEFFTDQVLRVPLAEWILKHTTENQLVVLRMESDYEIEILHRLIETEAIAHVDKYYTLSTSNLTLVNDILSDHVNNFGYWSYEELMYSDLKYLNRNEIPNPGKTISVCENSGDDMKFLLLLYSKDFSANAEHVLHVLSKSTDKKFPITVFLPHTFFKTPGKLTKNLLEAFTIGLYMDNDVISTCKLGNASCFNATQRFSRRYIKLRNTFIAAQRQMRMNRKILEYVFTESGADMDAITAIQSEYNFNTVTPSVDITYLTGKVTAGGRPEIEDLRSGVGEYLMINIDVHRAEYLAIYMIRRFRPWLIDISECNVVVGGDYLTPTKKSFLKVRNGRQEVGK